MAEKILLLASISIYLAFWIWAFIHAIHTPKTNVIQRALWGVAMLTNPATAIWYWYIWKRWAFWALVTPVVAASFALPLVVKSFLSIENETAITNALYGLGSARLVLLIAILTVFPLVLRFAALFHLGKNTDLSAMDRNDWIVSLALPVFGFGAGIAYCAKYRRAWAIIGLFWWVFIALALKTATVNVSQALIPAGEERREEIKMKL